MTVAATALSPDLEAEQALLGALLLAPSELETVKVWLKPSHFLRPAHAALYEVLLAQRASGHPGSAKDSTRDQLRDWALDALASAREASRGLTPSYASTLMLVCPTASHANAYGRMVLESAIRRQVHTHAHRLQHAARAGSLDDVLRLSAELHTAIHELATTWGSLDECPRPLPGPWPLELPDGIREKTLLDETALLSSSTSVPDTLIATTRWLRPSDFLDPGHGAVYQALAALARHAEPVDAMTVLWETQRRGAIASGAITADGVRAATRHGFSGDPQYWGERVLRASVLRGTADAAGVVRLLSRDTALPTARLLGSALHTLGTAEAVQDRWRTATGAPPRTQLPPAAVRADRRGAARVRTPGPVSRTAVALSPAEAAASSRSPVRSTR
ncbi:DnaB-like helicase N-terminal domain-containing protein [Kitasatospora sp. NPDC098663]|uniref:DnaB-like helicase N-terminal domain-containing protein n=1 Tax=Kitasatospora sp. NPDC098663 TaxID=3364096 RepID=UPI00380CA3A0